jgi:hypothetical protein
MTNHPNESDFERASELRRASDQLMDRLDRLYELESRKRELPPDRPEFVRLAREIEDLSRALLFSSGEEVELAEEIHADVKTGNVAADMPIRETPPKRDAVAVLAEWRAAERGLAAAPPDSTEESEARGEVERLRIEYRKITAPTPPDAPA